MSTLRLSVAAALAATAALAPVPALAQDVQYETVTKLEMPGAAGAAMRLAARLGGGSMETVETTYIQGRKLRTDIDGSSTVLDLEGGRFISIDHSAKTYSVVTLDELVRQAEQAAEQMRQASAEASGDDAAEARLDFRFSVDRAGERERVAGYDAERVFLTMEAAGAYAPEEGAEREEAGTLVVLTDMWTSRDVPILQARRAFDDASARQYADASAALMEGVASAFAQDPRYQVAFEQSVSEARKIEGMAVRTVTSFVSVAPGQRFDRAALNAPKQEGPSVAQRAGRAALGRIAGGLGGLRGGGQPQQEAEAESAPPQQVTMFTVTSEVRNVQATRLDPQLFEVPAGYREVSADGGR